MYYIIYGINQTDKGIYAFIEQNISEYALKKKEMFPEMLSKHMTKPNDFTIAFIKLIKKRWEL